MLLQKMALMSVTCNDVEVEKKTLSDQSILMTVHFNMLVTS